MQIIDDTLIKALSGEAAQSPRRRKNYNFHKRADDPLQRMLNAIEPDSYIQPHKHENPDKREAFLVLKGSALVVEFDDNGAITAHSIISPNAGAFGVEIAECVWHTIIALESGTVVYEVKDGPYDVRVDKNFAPWAPAEGDANAPNYLSEIKKKVGIESV